MLLHALFDPDAADAWLSNGDHATLTSYSVRSPDLMLAGHIDWLTARPHTYDNGLRFFVHAGVNPARAIAQEVADVGNEIGAAPHFTDASVFTPALGSPPTLILGPGEIAHQTDEYCFGPRIEQAADIYARLLRS